MLHKRHLVLCLTFWVHFTFELGDMDLEIIDSQTTLYFATFKDGTEIMTGQTAVTIKKGETKQATIRL